MTGCLIRFLTLHRNFDRSDSCDCVVMGLLSKHLVFLVFLGFNTRKTLIKWVVRVVYFFLDIPVYSVEVLPFSGGFTGHSLRSGDRYVVVGLYFSGNAHGRTVIQRFERTGSDEQDRRGAGYAAQTHTGRRV